MQRICVNPDALSDLGADLRQRAEQLRSAAARLDTALSRLDWIGSAKAGVDVQAGAARQQAGRLAETAEALGRFLLARADLFRTADGQALASLPWASGATAPIAPPSQPWGAMLGAAGLGPALPMLMGGLRRRHPELFGDDASTGITTGPARLHRLEREGPSAPAPPEPTRSVPPPARSRNPQNLTDMDDPERFYDRVAAPLTNDPGQRDRSVYDEVLNQFRVETNPRYQERDGNTFCNVYVLDVLWAMGAEIPGEDANKVSTWLAEHGPAHGWRAVSAAEAQAYANQGWPAVAAYHGGTAESGHLAMVRPGVYDPSNGPVISQAGAQNLNQATAVQGFGRSRLARIVYWVHE